MSFTRTLLLLLISTLWISGCSTFSGKADEDEFEMPDSVAIDLGIDPEKDAPKGGKPKTKPSEHDATGPATAIPTEQTAQQAAKDQPSGAKTIQDEDSAQVLERLKQKQAATPVARDAEHEAQAQQAKSEFNRAVAEMKKGNLDTAYARFDKLSKQYPTLAGPIVNQAIILRKKGEQQKAYDLLQNALLTHAKNPYLLNQLGVVSRELGKFKQAQVSYETAIRIDENYAKAHYNLGVLADLYLHDPALALSEFQKYQTLIPEPDKKVAGWIKELERRAK